MFDIKVIFVKESYTSQTYPVCGAKNKTNNGACKCKHCSFEGHKDAVGAFSIRAKYTGESLIVGALASPASVKSNPHLRGPGNIPWKLALSQ
ncbi:MAG: transposase [Thermotoga sp.]|nr:transposase [Thermotoga sp.]